MKLNKCIFDFVDANENFAEGSTDSAGLTLSDGVSGIKITNNYINATLQNFAKLVVSQSAQSNIGEYQVQVEYSKGGNDINLASNKIYVDVIGKKYAKLDFLFYSSLPSVHFRLIVFSLTKIIRYQSF